MWRDGMMLKKTWCTPGSNRFTFIILLIIQHILALHHLQKRFSRTRREEPKNSHTHTWLIWTQKIYTKKKYTHGWFGHKPAKVLSSHFGIKEVKYSCSCYTNTTEWGGQTRLSHHRPATPPPPSVWRFAIHFIFPVPPPQKYDQKTTTTVKPRVSVSPGCKWFSNTVDHLENYGTTANEYYSVLLGRSSEIYRIIDTFFRPHDVTLLESFWNVLAHRWYRHHPPSFTVIQ